MAETAKMTRKEKIAAGIPKGPKRKTAYAEDLKDARADICQVSLRNYRSSATKNAHGDRPDSWHGSFSCAEYPEVYFKSGSSGCAYDCSNQRSPAMKRNLKEKE